jgi:hypothetical protein
MITVRRSEERRHIDNDQQKTWMTFDWENEADPLRKGFGVLKIFNEEVLSPKRGFILHTHKDMVVITYVREGMIVFKGLGGVTDLLKTNEFHSIGADPGDKLSNFNHSPTEEAHVFQSGFTPGTVPLEHGSRKKFFTLAERKGILKLIASPDGKEASLKIQQDVQMYSSFIQKGNHMIHELSPGRIAWLHVVKGTVSMDGLQLQTGDGASFSGEISVSFTAKEPTEILLFDLSGQTPDELRGNGKVKSLAAVIH